MNITKEQYLSALTNKDLLNHRQNAVLKAIFESMSCKAHSREIGKRIGHKMGTVNLRFGRLGRRIAEYLNVKPEQRADGTYKWWEILAEGSFEKNGLNWALKKNLVDAILESGIFSENKIYPDEIDLSKLDLFEGGAKKVIVNGYERNSIAREECIKHYKAICQVCNINFENIYGEIGKDFIHVHHIVVVSKKGKERYRIDPVEDLRPVCPNCHAMLHRKSDPYTIDELREKIRFRFP